jgi:hypothetical protein
LPGVSDPSGVHAKRAYIELLKLCVSNAIHDDDLDMARGGMASDADTGKLFSVDPQPVDPKLKFYGAIWPSRAHTMIGRPRLDNLQYCVEDVLERGVPGDLLEAGVWRGGACILMRGILKAHDVRDRAVWVADSFEGLPVADRERYPKESEVNWERYGDLAVSLETVRGNFERYGLLDDQVRFLKGWFKDTLPAAPIEKLAVLRLDGDLYESTMDGLALYDKVSPGGFVIIDDYNAVPACNEAVSDFLRSRGISVKLTELPEAGAFWRRP